MLNCEVAVVSGRNTDPLTVFSDKRSKSKLLRDLEEIKKVLAELYADGYKKPKSDELLKYIMEYVDVGLTES